MTGIEDGNSRVLPPGAAVVRRPSADDWPAIIRLHDSVFGPGPYTRTAYRIREATPRISPFCLVSELDGELVATVRFTRIAIGGETGALLLGPLCVAPARSGQGYGKHLVATGLDNARAAGISIVVLVGAENYYGRFGFTRVPVGQVTLPGPVDLARLLAAELTPGSLAGCRGVITAVR